MPEYADVDKACRMIERHRDIVLGVKVRLTRNTIVSERSGMLPLYRAREAADAAGTADYGASAGRLVRFD